MTRMTIFAILLLTLGGCGRSVEADSDKTSSISEKILVPVVVARPATVLLVTSDALSDAWKPWAQWKTRLGKATTIITMSQIEKEYHGDDIQQKIRDCCLKHIDEHGTRWVVLGGDSQPDGKGLVPDRDTLHDTPFAKYDNIPTDIYYLSEKDWDANDDGVYGDWTQDKQAIAYTNKRASIGRIPVRTSDDVAAYTAKVIAYETKYPTKQFAGKLVYTCPVQPAFAKLGMSRNMLAQHWQDGELLQYFSAHTPWDKKDPGDHQLVPENWVTLINDRTCSKMHMHGHGLLPVWVLEDHETVDAGHVDRLTNQDAYLSITTVSCFTGQYDGKEDPAIGESMLRRAGGGAVLIVAPSREGVPVFHNPRRDFQLMVLVGKMDGTTTTMTRFWKHALAANLTAGEAMRAAKADMADDAVKTAGYHFLQCELNLLGDPTLDLRSHDPIKPQLTLPESIAQGKQTIELSTGAPGATVCLWKGSEVYQVTLADKTGQAHIEITCYTPGKLLVTISGPSLNAVQGEIAVR